mgnify:CR=1 FL=1
MGILVALIGVAIIAAVVVASFTAVLGGVIGGELEDERRIVKSGCEKLQSVFRAPFYYSSNVSFNLSMNPFFLAFPFDSEAGSSWFSVFPVN